MRRLTGTAGGGLLRRLFRSAERVEPESNVGYQNTSPLYQADHTSVEPITDLALPMEDEASLADLDRSYRGMYRLHQSAHQGLIAEIASRSNFSDGVRLLEVAAGTGWNAGTFIACGLEYWALDISENALKVLVRRFPTARTINCEIDEARILADGAFDIVYCASMLEHVADHERALQQLIRITGRELYIVFYEGLSTHGSDQFSHFPFDNPDWRRFHGQKFLAYQDRHNGYFMKRYSRQTIEQAVSAFGYAYEIFDRDSRSFLGSESVLHVSKLKQWL